MHVPTGGSSPPSVETVLPVQKIINGYIPYNFNKITLAKVLHCTTVVCTYFSGYID